MIDATKLSQLLQHNGQQTRVLTASQDLQAHAIDGVVPNLIVTPTTINEAAQIIHTAHEQNITVLPYGHGYHKNIGGLPGQIDILLCTQALDHLIEHEAPDLTCQVEAGITLATLQKRLAEKGQRLALDPPYPERTTVGGMLATNASGPKRLRYGTARDLVIGLQTIQANGDLARSGGRVVKNVAGYDLNKLYIGSFGTLGVIVEANFKLHPLPEREKTLIFTTTDQASLLQLAKALTHSSLSPSAIEFISTHGTYHTDFAPFHIAEQNYALAINYEGSTITITRQINDTIKLAQQFALHGNDLEGNEQERFWNSVRAHTQGPLVCKVSILLSNISQYIEYVEQLQRRYKLMTTLISHTGNGILYIEINPPDNIVQIVPAIAELRAYAQKLGGRLLIERCPTPLKSQIDVWGDPGADFFMMQKLKQEFDPLGTFVKGRFLGGL
ncbi:MAG TPA: FAD-binding oxidoreductase [Dictyobacter sp.]|jgi:glycolate oxidase FAD binding subunit|nr:FAD-binding oxidoreductase [Dictyobacter sp.]